MEQTPEQRARHAEGGSLVSYRNERFGALWCAWSIVVRFMGYLGLAVLLVGVILLVWATGFTWAHEAKPTASQPLGWTYDYGCCSSIDCWEMADGDVEEVANTFVIRRTGEVIPADDLRIKRSKDEFYHQCTPAGNRDAKRSICLYVPDRGI